MGFLFFLFFYCIWCRCRSHLQSNARQISHCTSDTRFALHALFSKYWRRLSIFARMDSIVSFALAQGLVCSLDETRRNNNKNARSPQWLEQSSRMCEFFVAPSVAGWCCCKCIAFNQFDYYWYSSAVAPHAVRIVCFHLARFPTVNLVSYMRCRVGFFFCWHTPLRPVPFSLALCALTLSLCRARCCRRCGPATCIHFMHITYARCVLWLSVSSVGFAMAVLWTILLYYNMFAAWHSPFISCTSHTRCIYEKCVDLHQLNS